MYLRRMQPQSLIIKPLKNLVLFWGFSHTQLRASMRQFNTLSFPGEYLTQNERFKSSLPCISIPLSNSHDASNRCTCRRTKCHHVANRLESAEPSLSSVESSPSSSTHIPSMQPVRWLRIVLREAALAVSTLPTAHSRRSSPLPC
jgi:hypothetical protein